MIAITLLALALNYSQGNPNYKLSPNKTVLVQLKSRCMHVFVSLGPKKLCQSLCQKRRNWLIKTLNDFAVLTCLYVRLFQKLDVYDPLGAF